MDMQRAPRLTLVGSVHRDPLAEERLRRLLMHLRPDALTLEMSPYALAYRRREGPRQRRRLEGILRRIAAEERRSPAALRSHPAIEDILTLLELPGEYRAAAAHAAAAHIPLSLIDLSDISARKLEKVGAELITVRNLRMLLQLSSAERACGSETLGAARTMLFGDPGSEVRRAFLARRRGTEGIGLRDRHMAAQIRRRLEPGRHLVHIGGWVHLMADDNGETLFSRLLDLTPRRLLLEEKIGFQQR